MTVHSSKQYKRRDLLFRQRAKGRADGFQLGFDHGRWFGQCEALLSRMEQPAEQRPFHVMYVATGKGFPYSPLDEAIAQTLQSLVVQVTVTDPSQPVAAIAAQLRPDIVLVLDGVHFDVGVIDHIRSFGIRTAIWFTDDPYYTDITGPMALHYDDVFTLELSCVEWYRSLGCERVHYLPLGAHPPHFRPRNPELGQRHDICFIGTAFWNRIGLIDQTSEYLASKDTYIAGIWWDRLQSFERLRDKIDLGRWMLPTDTAAIYNGAKVVINMHRGHDDPTINLNSAQIPAVSPNPRTFEISACATLQFTDARSDMASFYTPGVEIETYTSPEELIGKVDYYLHHEEERQAIALRGMFRTMRDHTYRKRLETMLSLLFG